MTTSPIYFGHIWKTWDQYAQIDVLAKKQTRDTEWAILDTYEVTKEVGETKSVFLPKVNLNHFSLHSLVQFEIEPIPRKLKENQDSFQVKLVNWEPQISRQGAFILESFENALVRDELHEILQDFVCRNGIPNNSKIYVACTHSGEQSLAGPFLIADGKWKAKTPCRPFVFPLRNISLQSVKSTYFSIPFFPEEPSQKLGSILDLDSPAEKGRWIILRFKRAGLSQALQVLDQQIPDWRDALRMELERNNVTEQALWQQRWNDFKNLFTYLVQEQKLIEELLQTPQVQAWRQQFLARQEKVVRDEAKSNQNSYLEKLKEQMEADKTVLEAQIQKEQHNQRKKLQQLEQACRKAQEMREIIERQIQDRQEDLHALAELQHESRDHWQAAKKRLFQDFQAFLICQGSEIRENPLTPTTTGWHPSPFNPSTDDSCVDEKEFVNRMLFDNFAACWPGVKQSQAQSLHAAILNCRFTCLGSLAWIKAYAQAIGPASHLEIVTVPPDWLCFEDAWQARLGPFFQGLVNHEDRLFFLVFQDFNRSLPECWARPLMDLASDLLPGLPKLDYAHWPANLRIIVIPAKDQAALPFSEPVKAYMAQIPERAFGTTLKPLPKGPQPWVSASTWLGWTNRASVSPIDWREVLFEPVDLLHRARTETERLWACLCRLNQSGDNPTIENLRRKALKMRGFKLPCDRNLTLG
ncbi:hypothetical protein SCOR_28925 [Sulfidibacter corallicola]|uniref:Uncharacterized protein n=1 Tax=Sulfidibacter corallicola TaxID=2818388 RepID=A0A8A4TK81_SULCO|nr:hypothetical protein [Sulfidibacter corallicola]QTD50419.1 hypothetical protein J3U87_32955 [Sulfidibacter corallicola]